MNKPLFTSNDWVPNDLERILDVVCSIGKEMGLDFYEPQIEIISLDQMFDACSSVGLPNYYNHWSFGEEFLRQKHQHKHGGGRVLELIINSDPSIAYCVEDNTAAEQTLVFAHACVGHSSFFKNNYLFKQNTDAKWILNYLDFAKKYVKKCEDEEGEMYIETFMNILHGLQQFGVDTFKHNRHVNKAQKQKRINEYLENANSIFNYEHYKLLSDNDKNIITHKELSSGLSVDYNDIHLPEENILYFLEKYSKILEPFQKELIRIVRKIAQYFYPQGQTKVMNEGWATFWEFEICQEMHSRGYLTDGSWMEMIKLHTNILSPGDDTTFNPYMLGYYIFRDIKRICENPDKEDYRYFKNICNTDWKETLNFIMCNYRDSSFIQQFLSPRVIRELRLYNIKIINEFHSHYRGEIEYVHDDISYEELKYKLSESYLRQSRSPCIEITDINNYTNILTLQYRPYKNIDLDLKSVIQLQEDIRKLWGGPVFIYDQHGVKYEKESTKI